MKIKPNKGQEAAIDTIAIAYLDCADFIDGLAKGVVAAMPALSPLEQHLCKVVIEHIAIAVRSKGNMARQTFSLALSEQGEA